MYYSMMALEEITSPIIERECRMEEQVSEKAFSKLLAGLVEKTWRRVYGLTASCREEKGCVWRLVVW